MRSTVVGAAAFVTALLTAVPAQAGWFDSQEPQAPAASDRVVAEIERALDDERYVDAGALLDQALLGSESDSRLLVLAGNLALARSHADQALAYFKSVDSVAAVRPRALQGEGISLATLGRNDEAIAVLERAVAEDASAWRAWNALGVEYDQRHDWQKADTAFDHAMSGSGGSPIVLNNRGFSRLSQNRLQEATQDFVLALQKKPGFAPARNNLRMAIALGGDYEKAVSGAAADERASVLNNAGFIAMTRGDYAKARELFEQAIKAKGSYYALAAENLELAKNLEAGKSRPDPDAARH